MFLHISHDDKFIDSFIRRQRKYFNQNENIYLIYSDSDQLKFVRSDNIHVFKLYSDEFHTFIRSLKIERVYIHYFNSKLSEFVLSLPDNCEIYWVFWGSDGFYLPQILKRNLDEYALAFYKRYHPYLLMKSGLIYFLHNYRWKKRVNKHIQAIKRVNYFCHYSEEDYEMIRSVTGFQAKLLEFNYGSLNDFTKPDDKLSLISDEGRDSIMLGNSADESNNHISAMEAIKKKNIDFSMLICPLSYAGHHDYVDYVIKKGRAFFGHRFYPLTQFMAKDEYDNLLKKCKLFIYNHKRSQAYTNIAWLLFAGGTVVMNRESSLTRYLIDHQLIIKKIDDNNWYYSENEKLNNSVYIEKLLNEQAVVERYKNIFCN